MKRLLFILLILPWLSYGQQPLIPISQLQGQVDSNKAYRDSITAISGRTAGGGEANTASNLGGGLANFASKSGVDLRFNSFDPTDFDLASNLFNIDATLKSTWNGKQAGDQDLTDIAALAPTNDDILQRKSGAWTNSSLAQLKADLSLSGINTGDQTTVTGNAGSATTTAITDDAATNATMYPTWVTAATGNLPQKVSSTKFTFNPSTGIVTATGFAGPLTGNVTGNVSGTAPAGSLTGTTLNSGVVTSSLTTVGTIGTGTWNAGLIAGQYGGTGVANTGKTITLGGNLTTSGAFATTLTATATTAITLPTTGTVATLAGTETFSGKTLTAPIISSIVNTGTMTLPTVTGTLTQYIEGTTASSATPTPTGDDRTNYYDVTALAAGATIAAPSGTPANHNALIMRIKDNGTARSLAFNAIYRFSTDLTAPTTTIISKTLYLGFIYNSASTTWDCVSVINNY